MDKPKIVRNTIIITESEVKFYGANFIDNKIEDCKQDAINVARANNYKNPKVTKQTLSSKKTDVDFKWGWRNCALPCEYSVVVEDVEE